MRAPQSAPVGRRRAPVARPSGSRRVGRRGDSPAGTLCQFFSSSGFWARHCFAARSRICAAAAPSPRPPRISCCAGALPFRSTCGGKKFWSQICLPVVLSCRLLSSGP